jgi:hypothetical protein
VRDAVDRGRRSSIRDMGIGECVSLWKSVWTNAWSCGVRSRAVWRVEFRPVVSTGACADDRCWREDLLTVDVLD